MAIFISKITQAETEDSGRELGSYPQCLREIATKSPQIVDRVGDLKALGCWSEPQIEEISEIAANLEDLILAQKEILRDVSSESVSHDSLAFKNLVRLYHQNYKYLIDQISFCRIQYALSANTLSPQFEESPEKMLFHILGDFLGTDTSFDGGLPKSNLAHRIFVLSAYRDQMKDRVFIASEKEANPCQELDFNVEYPNQTQPDIASHVLNHVIEQLEIALELNAVQNDTLPKYLERLKFYVERLKPNQNIYYSSGWDAHAVVFQITRQTGEGAQGTFQFRVFNSGAGIGAYHVSAKSGSQTQFMPFVERKNIPHEQLFKPIFIRALQATASPISGTSQGAVLYEKALALLDGVSEIPAYEPRDFRAPQFAGTCSYFPLPWMLDASVGNLDGTTFYEGKHFVPDQLENVIKLAAIRDYAQIFSGETEALAPEASETDAGFWQRISDYVGIWWSSPVAEEVLSMPWGEGPEERRVRLLGRILEDYNLAAAGAGYEGALGGGELQFALGITRPAHEWVETEKKKFAQGANKDQGRLAFSGSEQRDIPVFGKNEHKFEILAGDGGGSSSETTFTLDLSAFDDFSNPSKMIEALETFYDKVLEGYKKYPDVVSLGVARLSRKFPLKLSEWGIVSPEQLVVIASLVSKIQTPFLYTYALSIDREETPSVDTETMLTIVSFFSGMDIFRKQAGIEDLPLAAKGEPWLPLILDDSALLETKDPDWHRRIQDLRGYWKAQKILAVKTFLPEKLTAGHQIDGELRLFDDPEALDILHPSQIRDEDRYEWVMLEKISDWIRAQPDFSQWLEKEKVEADSSGEGYVYPWISRVYENNIPVGIITETSRVTEDLLVRREAIRLFLKNENSSATFFPKTDYLPALYYEMRQSVFLLDALSHLRLSNLSEYFENNLSGKKIIQIDAESDVEVIEKARDLNMAGSQQRIRSTKLHFEKIKFYFLKHPLLDESKFNFGSYSLEDRDDGGHVFPYSHLQKAFRRLNRFANEESEESNGEELRKYLMTDDSGTWSSLDNSINAIRRRVPDNQAILLRPSEINMTSLGLEKTRALLSVSEHPETQIVQTLAFFDKYPDLLDRPDYQVLFEKLVYEPGLISDQLRISAHDSELFLEMVNEFCRRHFNNFLGLYDYKGMAFVLEFNHYIQAFFEVEESLGKAEMPKIMSEFMDSAEEIRKLIAGLNEKQENIRGFLYLQLSALFLFNQQLSNEQVYDLLLGRIGSRVFQSSADAWSDAWLERMVQSALTRQSKAIRKVFGISEALLTQAGVVPRPEPGLSRIVKEFYPGIEAKLWQLKGAEVGKPPGSTFVSELSDGDFIEIDVLAGTIYRSGGQVVKFPISMADYSKIYPGKPPPTAKEISHGVYEWENSEGNLCRMSLGDENVYQQQFDKIWFQYQPKHQIDSHTEGGSAWSFDAFDRWVALENQNSFINWGNSGYKLADSTTRKPKFQTAISGKNEKVVRLEDGATLYSLMTGMDYESADGPFKVFSAIEDPRYIWIWQKPGVQAMTGFQDVESVELPRFGLQFRPKMLNSGEIILDCATQEGYHLAQEMLVESLGYPINYLKCEADWRGNSVSEKILLPQYNYFRQPRRNDNVDSTLHPFFRPVYGDAKRSKAVFFWLNSNGQQILNPSQEERSFLAYRSYFQMEYGDSYRWLKGAMSEGRAITAGEKRILVDWVERDPKAKDAMTKGLQLLAAIELVKAARLLGEPPAHIYKAAQLYKEYLNNLEQFPDNFLPLDQEILFVRVLVWWDPAWRNRLKELLGKEKKGEQETKYAIDNHWDHGYAEYNCLRPLTEVASLQPVLFPESSPGLNEALDESYISPGVLDISDSLVPSNYKILYRMASDDPKTNWDAVLRYLSLIYNQEIDVASMSHAELRVQFKDLLFLAQTAVGKSCSQGSFTPQNKAGFLWAVMQTHDEGEKVPSLEDIKESAEEYGKALKYENAFLEEKRGEDPSYELFEDRSDLGQKLFWKRGKLEVKFSELFNAVLKNGPSREPPSVGVAAGEAPGPAAPVSRSRDMPPAGLSELDLVNQALDFSDPLQRPMASSSDVFSLFEILSISAADAQGYRERNTELADALKISSTSNKRLQAQVETLKVDLINHMEQVLENREVIELKDIGRLEAFSQKIINGDLLSGRESLVQLEARTDELEESIVTLGRKASPNLLRSAQFDLLKRLGFEKEVAFEDILVLMTRENALDYFELKGGLVESDILKLRRMSFEYLLKATYHQQIERVLEAIEGIRYELAMGSDRRDPASFQLMINHLVSLMRSHRNYEPAENPTYLVFEYFMEVLIRKNQIESLSALDVREGEIQNPEAIGSVLEMIMGSGKTYVLLPLLAAMNTKHEDLNVIVLPEPLLASMSRQLAMQLETAFGQSVFVFHLTRQSDLDDLYLDVLYDQLQNARINHQTIITTNSSIQSFFLHFLNEIYEAIDSGRGDILGRYRNIFAFFQKYGNLTIDEVDLALDVLKSHHFSVGGKTNLNPAFTASTFAFYRFLATNPTISSHFSLPFLQGSSSGQALTAEAYEAFKPTLIDRLVGDSDLFLGIPTLSRVYKDFVADSDNRDALASYWQGEDSSSRKKVLELIDDDFGEFESDYLKNSVVILYEEINRYFLLTASKKKDVHYGAFLAPVKGENESPRDFSMRQADQLQSEFIALPYHGGKAMSRSRFGTEIESLNYAIQLSLERIDLKGLVNAEVDVLRRLVGKSKPQNRQRHTDRVKKLLGNLDVNLLEVEDGDIDEIAHRIAQNNEVDLKLNLIWRHVLPQLRTYQKQISTNAQIYGSIFKHVQGFSGTLWSAQTFPKIFEKAKISDTTERTFSVLWQSHKQQRENGDPIVLRLTGNQEVDFVDHAVGVIYGGWEDPGSLIDDGGIFRGISNRRVAESILASDEVARDSRIGGVVFYDESDNLMILEKHSGEAVAFERSQIEKDARIAFWDKKHTTGSDIPLRLDMSAKLTFDHNTFSRDLQQSVWRLRGLEKGQRVVQYVVLEADYPVVLGKLSELTGLEVPGLGLAEVLLYVFLNQEDRLSDLTFRALRQKFKNVLVDNFLKMAFDTNLSESLILDEFKAHQFLFESTVSQNPYHVLGKKDEIVFAEEAAKGELDKVLKELAALQAKGMSTGVHSQLNERLQKIFLEEWPLLSEKVQIQHSESGTEVEVEMELESEQEEEQEQEQEQEEIDMNRNYDPHLVEKWPKDPDNLFRADFFTPIESDWLDDWRLFEWDRDGWVPIISLPDALLREDEHFLAEAFSGQIFVSLNLAPLHHDPDKSHTWHYSFDFFNVFNKNISNVLIIQDILTEDYRVVLIDGNELKYFENLLRDDQEGDVEGHRDHRLALYNLQEGIFRQGGSLMDVEKVENDPKLLKLLVEVFFLNGNIWYPQEMEPILYEWMKNNNPQKLYDIFYNRILTYKRDSRRAFPDSTIGEIFEELL